MTKRVITSCLASVKHDHVDKHMRGSGIDVLEVCNEVRGYRMEDEGHSTSTKGLPMRCQ